MIPPTKLFSAWEAMGTMMLAEETVEYPYRNPTKVALQKCFNVLLYPAGIDIY